MLQIKKLHNSAYLILQLKNDYMLSYLLYRQYYLLKSMQGLNNSLDHSQITIRYEDLVAGQDLKDIIQKAYGPKGHGILFVTGIPNYPEARRATLPLFHKLANLPPETLKKYIHPEIFHVRGWSCGVQEFQQGKPDTSKGSFYFNAVTDEPYTPKPEQQALFTQKEKKLFIPNVWVKDLPQIEKNVKTLSKIIIEAGTLLAKQIDDYAHDRVPTYPKDKLYNIIKAGKNHIGRLLHYFPFEHKGQTLDDWCGQHNDHGSLTALTSALYTDQNGQQIKFPVKTGGLYAKNRLADAIQVKIPPDALAFQLGQSSQIHTGGFLEATPHCVVRSEQLAGKKISRNTFALFMQSDLLEKMVVPEGINPENVTEKEAYEIPPIKLRYKEGMTFKQFNDVTIQMYSTQKKKKKSE